MAYFLSAEQSLQFTLGRCITFLYLGTTGINGFCSMCFGRTGCSTTAVTSGLTAKQDDDVARIGIQTLYRASRSRTHNRADLHTLRNVIRMIDFFYIAGRKSDLVSVRTVSVCSGTHDLLLRQFSVHGIFYRYGRICRTGHTHCLINIGTSGKRITDRTAKAGCRATERLDLRRMVVCFIFEVYKPLLGLSVHFYRNNDRAGIDLIGFLLICQLSFFFQALHCHERKIHQADKFILSSFVKILVCLKIIFIGILDRCLVKTIIKFYIL